VSSASTDAAARFAAALTALEAELPWTVLGPLYCHEGGEDFFAPAQVEAIRETGLRLAADVAQALGSAESEPAERPRPRASLYFGAAVAELVPALCERVVLGRTVHLLNRPGHEPGLLNAALERAEERLRAGGDAVALPRVEVDEHVLEQERFDHVWLVSVLTDPEAFPALHDELYGLRHAAPERRPEGLVPTRRGNLAAERERARELARRVLSRLEPPGVLTTTDEELGLLRAVLEERGLKAHVPSQARLSAIVGDPVRCCPVRG